MIYIKSMKYGAPYIFCDLMRLRFCCIWYEMSHGLVGWLFIGMRI